MKHILIAIIISFWFVSINNAQTTEDFDFANTVFSKSKHTERHKLITFDNPNEFQQIAIGTFSFYKCFFSSQDGNHCIFYPSCSTYTIQSIKKNGILTGIVDGIDRLQRCNKLSINNYEKYKNTNYLYDPVE